MMSCESDGQAHLCYDEQCDDARGCDYQAMGIYVGWHHMARFNVTLKCLQQ